MSGTKQETIVVWPSREQAKQQIVWDRTQILNETKRMTALWLKWLARTTFAAVITLNVWLMIYLMNGGANAQ